MANKVIKIGGASGYWGDAASATPQLLASKNLDYIVYDYLAEITMSIMARARGADPSKGYATDFVSATLKPNLKAIAEQGVKVISNAGGVNPQSCAEAARALIKEQGLNLKVAVVLGDDLLEQKKALADTGVTEMFNSSEFPPLDSVVSINAYLGAFPIAHALDLGADIVITGRCVDSAVTLGACIHEFGWKRDDFDLLAQASLAGHLIECGTQVSGGNFTDWELAVDTLATAGYPIVEVESNGDFVCTKPEGSGGLVSFGTVAEQLVYEIGDAQCYQLPDVICDFSGVELSEVSANRVLVTGAKGIGAPDSYKTCVTYADGFRGGRVITLYGRDADRKGAKLAENIFIRVRQVLEENGLPDFTDTSVEMVGAEDYFGVDRRITNVREVDVKIAATHSSVKGIAVLLKESTGILLSSPPGVTGFAGARPKPSPIVRLFSMLVPKGEVNITVETENTSDACSDVVSLPAKSDAAPLGEIPQIAESSFKDEECVEIPLVKLAWGRSGDKGNKANIGIIARKPEYLPYIASAMSVEKVAHYFQHFLAEDQPTESVERFYLPGINALNFMLHEVLGGGGMASLRNDPQGKGYAQILLDQPVRVHASLAKAHNL
ncbi:MAG: DUF1446 domain-containing protein [Pseudomonadales bacterium]|nr:DUF1446 domain-containing protein [Pseudomonadales bacterium]